MKPNTKTLNALRLALDLEAIAEREGVPLAEVLKVAGNDPASFVREWIKLHYLEG